MGHQNSMVARNCMLFLLLCCTPCLGSLQQPWWTSSVFNSSPSDECDVRHTPMKDRCEYIGTHQEACSVGAALINYLKIVFCWFEVRPWLATLAMLAWILLLFTLAIVTAEHFFCPALEEISAYLGLPDHLAGATLLALGNGANDVFTMIAALSQGKGKHGISTALSEAYGSGLFVANVVLAAVTAFSAFQPIALERKAVSRDMLFYLGAVVLVFGIFIDRQVHLWEGAMLFAYYIVYLLVTIWSNRGAPALAAPHPNPTIHHEIPHHLHNGSLNYSGRSHESEVTSLSPVDELEPGGLQGVTVNEENVNVPVHPLFEPLLLPFPLNGESLSNGAGPHKKSYERQPSRLSTVSTMSSIVVERIGVYNKAKAALEGPFVWLLRLVMPQVDPEKPYPKWCAVVMPLLAPLFVLMAQPSLLLGIWTSGSWLYGLLSSLMACALLWSAYPNDGLSFGPFAGVFVVLAFIQSIIVLNIAANELMSACNAIGQLAGFSPSFLAATLMAWGNSLQDLISNVTMAATGFPLVSVTACIAAPLSNLLAGVGLGLLVHVCKFGPITDIMIPNSLIVLFVSHVLLLLRYTLEVPLVSSWKLTRWTALGSLLLWAVVVPTYVLTSMGIIFKTPWLP